MSEPSSTQAGAARIDRWLFAVRLAPSRALATVAVGGGRVHINGARVKPAHPVRPGDTVTMQRGAALFECIVLGIPRQRVLARAAQGSYAESAQSVQRRAELARQLKIAGALAPRPRTRPDKHERARLRRLRGRI